MQYIYVVDQVGKPLMPTKRLGKVRHWLKSGEARWYKNRRDTIQFTRSTSSYTQDINLGVDMGFHLGMSAVSPETKQEYYASESNRKNEHTKITDKRMYRRTRRNRLRHRKSRFDNRKRKPGYLAPSIQHYHDFIIREIKRIYTFLPVTNLIIEVGSFDNQKLANPKIKPWEYSQGKMAGYKTVKDYLLVRDNYRDALDGKQYPASQLRVHHLQYRSRGGSNEPDNLILLSNVHHNQANHNNGVLAKLVKARQNNIINYRGAYFMSLMANRLYNYFPDYIQTQGYITSNKRKFYNISKSHINDAFVIAGGTDEYSRTSNVYNRLKVPNNNRSLQKFYDAKYVDVRDGKIKSASILSSGRTRRSLEINYDNQRIYRGQKVKAGRISIRRQHYQLRPHDVIKNLKTGTVEIVKGVISYGKAVKLQSDKTVSTKFVQCLYHVNGLVEQRID